MPRNPFSEDDSELHHKFLIYVKNLDSIKGLFGSLIVLTLRFCMGVSSIIHTFIVISLIFDTFKKHLDWINYLIISSIVYNCIMGFYLFIVSATDIYASSVNHAFAITMSNCWYITFFFFGFLVTVMLSNVDSNKRENNINIILSCQFIITILMAITNIIPFCVFCVTLDTLGMSRTFFPRSDEEIETLELATTVKKLIKDEVRFCMKYEKNRPSDKEFAYIIKQDAL